VLRDHGALTPNGVVVRDLSELDTARRLKSPWIVKPAAGGASCGVNPGAVVFDEEGLRKRVELHLQNMEQPALVEEFVDGREFTVALLQTGNREFTVLPIVEVLFDSLPEGSPHIYTYEAKWEDDTPECRGTFLECPADIDEDLEESIKQTVIAAARAVDARDYVRIDIRARRDNNAVVVLDVNPNPAFSAGSAFVFAAEASGRTYSQILNEILRSALDRHMPTGRDD